jgi:predicted branched-subunit amino acid permease
MSYKIDYGVIGEYLGCMLFHLIAWEEFIFLIVFIIIFGLSFYKTRLGICWNSYLLVWLVVMHSKVFYYLFIITIIICNVALRLVHHQKTLLSPDPPTQN